MFPLNAPTELRGHQEGRREAGLVSPDFFGWTQICRQEQGQILREGAPKGELVVGPRRSERHRSF